MPLTLAIYGIRDVSPIWLGVDVTGSKSISIYIKRRPSYTRASGHGFVFVAVAQVYREQNMTTAAHCQRRLKPQIIEKYHAAPRCEQMQSRTPQFGGKFARGKETMKGTRRSGHREIVLRCLCEWSATLFTLNNRMRSMKRYRKIQSFSTVCKIFTIVLTIPYCIKAHLNKFNI